MLIDNINISLMVLNGGTVSVGFGYGQVLSWKLSDYFDELTIKDIKLGREVKGIDFLKKFTIKKFRKELDKFIEDNSYGLKLITRGHKCHSDDCTSGVHYWIFPKGSKEEDIIPFLETFFGIEPEGYGTGTCYDCSGREFKDPLYVEECESGKTVIATQGWGLDI